MNKSDDIQSPFKGVSRREFMKYCGTAAAFLSIPGCADKDIAKTLSDAAVNAKSGTSAKPRVIWLEGQDCAGCSTSFLNLDDYTNAGTKDNIVSIQSVILDTISLRYHETVMAASGGQAESALTDIQEEGNYILVVEGAIPKSEDSYCKIGGTAFRETLIKAAAKASFVVAFGSCASTGGVVQNMSSEGRPVSYFVTDKPVVNLPMCPGHYEHLLLSMIYLLQNGAAPELDSKNRPKLFFSNTVHSACPRRDHYTLKKYLTDWNDATQKDYCLLGKGCKGVTTYSDCTLRGFNGGVSFCTKVGSPCQGCAETTFYDGSAIYADRTLEIT